MILFSIQFQEDYCIVYRSFFRGDVIIAGYVFKVITENPPEVELTYVTRADLKGIYKANSLLILLTI